MGDSWSVALENLLRFREAEKLGLSLNEQKREVKAFGSNKHDDIESTFRHHFPIIQCIPAEGKTLLGAGLGQSAVRNELIDKLDKLKTLISRTYKLPARTAFFLIKNCFFFVLKFMYVLRSSPPFNHGDMIHWSTCAHIC